ncbi:MAG: glycosyltransferase [Clostridiales bacterium]|nr:glycosyltransferase [Clostridiales bacterium]
MVRGTPQITVLMSVYNGESYLAEAVDSILGQTFSDFIFLILDDASTDATPEMLKRYAARDNRITIITNERNLGLAASLNRGISHIDTPYIARMDADDISLPERLEKQLAFIESQPETVALGSWVEAIDAAGAPVESQWFMDIRRYLDHADICKALLLGQSVLVHPSAMLRTVPLKNIGGYRACFRYAQDYDLWLRLLPIGKLAVLPETYLRYRIHAETASVAKLNKQRIANVSALSAALIRERGATDPLQDCSSEALDENRMMQLMDAAGAAAWLRWLEYSSYGETGLTSKELRAIRDRIIGIDWYANSEEGQTRHIRASDVWLSSLYGKIIDLHNHVEYLQNHAGSLQQYSETLNGAISGYRDSKSWKSTAPLRKLATSFRALRKKIFECRAKEKR